MGYAQEAEQGVAAKAEASSEALGNAQAANAGRTEEGATEPRVAPVLGPEGEPLVVAGLRTSSLTPAAYWVPIEVVLRWAGNPRENDEAIDPVVESIREYGFGAPLVARVENGELIAGDTRIQAAARIGMTHVPVRFMGLSAEQAHLLAVADNRLGEKARWDAKRLAAILEPIKPAVAKLVGFEGDALARILALAKPKPTAPDVAPPLPAEAVSKLGEVYELGPHRLVCGDACDPATWDLLLGEELLQMVWTDPPYGVAIVGGSHALSPEERLRRGGKTIENDEIDPAKLREFLNELLGRVADRCVPGAAWYVASPANADMFLAFATVLGSDGLGIWRHTTVWVKDRFVLGRADYHYRHEDILYGWVPGGAHYFVDDRKLDTVFDIPRPQRNADHPTMKPIELVARCIRNSSKHGWLVGEPCGGSGTTLMACAQEGRVARVVELDPRYCDVIRRRWTAYAEAAGIDPGPGALAAAA